MERKMTIKEAERLHVMRELNSKRISLNTAAKEMGVGLRQTFRIRARYLKEGATGLTSRRLGQAPGNKIPDNQKQEAIALIRDRYYDFGPTFAREKLSEVHGIRLSREWVRNVMREEGIWKAKTKKKTRLYKRRVRRSRYGELVQVDGSYHAWFEDRGEKACLLVAIDDATGDLLGLRFCHHETTEDYMKLFKDYFSTKGKPVAIYSDKHGVFRVNKGNEGGKKVTQLGRALKELKIDLIYANTPQAKGRVERKNALLQDRLIKEMRLREIETIEEGNEYVSEFIKDHNVRFGQKPYLNEDAHRKVNTNLDEILALKETRKLSKDLTFHYKSNLYQIAEDHIIYRMRGSLVEVIDTSKGLIVKHQGQELSYTQFDKLYIESPVMGRKELEAHLDKKKPLTAIARHRKKAGGWR